MTEKDGAGFPELESGGAKPIVNREASGVSTTNSSSSPIDKDPAVKFRFLVSVFGILALATYMYFWNEKMAQGYGVESRAPKSGQARKAIKQQIRPPKAPEPVDLPNAPIESDGSCDAVCDKRKEARISKFGGDLLDVKDVVRLAKQAREEIIASVRETYGTYFDAMFVDDESNTTEARFNKLNEVGGERSAYLLRRKLKVKVLRMMQAVRQKESNVLGCDCVQRQGKAMGTPKESVESIPDFYEKYVFVNGGHSQAAAHGNRYDESYTAVLTEDLKPIWKAMGIDFIGRNYAVGAMPATPIVSTCSKETFGTDVDFLTWNYGMTDSNEFSAFYYFYRAAINPGRPALLMVDPVGKEKRAGPFVEAGISIHTTKVSAAGIPDSKPDGIPLAPKEIEAMPFMVQYLFENRRFGKTNKWSCTKKMHDSGSDCKCWGIKGQTGWHGGYKVHALQGHEIALPFIDILFDALEEIIQSNKDVVKLLSELEEEEKADYENFISHPIIGQELGIYEKNFGVALDSPALLETWFKGPSICRTGLLPSQSRFLGITTNSYKIGDVARCGEETYDIGTIVDRNAWPDLGYTIQRGPEPVPGEFNLMGWTGVRYCVDKEQCPYIVKPDYPDYFWGVLKDGKTSVTFPNEREKEYYGYDAEKFKGIIGLIPPLMGESYGKGPNKQADFSIEDLKDHAKISVNGKPVAKLREFISMVILEDENGSVFWPPNENDQYVFEFEPFGFIESRGRDATEQRIRLSGFVLY